MEIYAVKILSINIEMLNKLCLSIDPTRKSRIDKFHDKNDKIRSLIGEILIRTIIIDKFKISNANIQFVRNKFMKPYLNGYPQFNFNISHSGDFVLCAVDNKPIGIDIEKIRPINYSKIIKRFFHTNELNYILNQNPVLQLNHFYEIWTLRESYVKCCGKGLSISLKSFYMKIGNCKNIRVISNFNNTRHIFKIFNIERNYKIAICSTNNNIPNKIETIEQSMLINKYFNLTIMKEDNTEKSVN